MALGAADRQAQEGLADVFGHVLGRLAEGVEVRRPVLHAFAGGRDDLAHQLVPGRVGRHLLADPLVIGLERLGPEPRAVEHQQVGPLIRPVVGELGPGKQAFDQRIALARRTNRRGRCATSSTVGSQPDRVEIRPADEFGVGAGRRGGQVQPRQLLVDLLVDEVARLARVDLLCGIAR